MQNDHSFFKEFHGFEKNSILHSQSSKRCKCGKLPFYKINKHGDQNHVAKKILTYVFFYLNNFIVFATFS